MAESYYAIIPANVRYDKNLCSNAKLLYGEITALSYKRGYCLASNGYFAGLYEVSLETVSRWISQLVENKYISRTMKYKEGTREITDRYLQISQDPADEIINTPIDEIVKDNTTVPNNAEPPTLEEVVNYFKEKGYNELKAIQAFNFYEARNWLQKNGKPVTNWKQAMSNIWFNSDVEIRP